MGGGGGRAGGVAQNLMRETTQGGGAGGAHWEGATVGGMTGEHAHLQWPVRRDVCRSNLRRLRIVISLPDNLRTQYRHVRHEHMHGWHAANCMSCACMRREWHGSENQISGNATVKRKTHDAKWSAVATHAWQCSTTCLLSVDYLAMGVDCNLNGGACLPAQSRLLRLLVQTGQRIAIRCQCADSHPVCCPTGGRHDVGFQVGRGVR